MKNSALAKLQNLSLNSALAHAWLFAGADDGDKLQTVMDFSQWLLCSAVQQNVACGVCKHCTLFIAGSHPDFYRITIKEDNTAILVDDLRDLNHFMRTKAQFAQKKIVLIFPAEKMNKQAANALLKNLEEPGLDTFLFLLTAHKDLLLKTIVSRCQVLTSNSDASANGQTIEAVGQILNNLYNLWVTRAVTPIEIIESWVKQWPNEVLYWFELALADLLVSGYTPGSSLSRYPNSHTDQVAMLNNVDINKLWLMLGKIQQARFYYGTGAKPNLQLILEDVVLP